MTAQNLTSKKSYFGSYIRYRIFKNKNLLILSFVFSAMYMLLFTGCMMFCTGFVNDFINSGAITEEGVSKTMGTVDVVKVTGEVILAISAVVLFILTIVVSNVMFSYNLKKCDGDMYLPLPLTTTQRIFCRPYLRLCDMHPSAAADRYCEHGNGGSERSYAHKQDR